MDNQISTPKITIPVPEVPQERNAFPWQKYLLIGFFIVVLINLILYFFYFRNNGIPFLKKELLSAKDERGFSIISTDQKISREGYTITFSNPRYEHLDAESYFRVDVLIANDSFEPAINVIANCDVEERGVIIREGAGVSIERGESRPVLPGNSNSWTALVILANKDQKVSSCVYAPAGVFDPKQTVRVIF